MLSELLPGAIVRSEDNAVILELGRGIEIHVPAALAGPIRHGSRYSYNNRGCRCPECREASSEYHRARRERLRANAQ